VLAIMLSSQDIVLDDMYLLSCSPAKTKFLLMILCYVLDIKLSSQDEVLDDNKCWLLCSPAKTWFWMLIGVGYHALQPKKEVVRMTWFNPF